MTRISAQSNVITLINVFTVKPANQRRLVELLTEATEASVRRAPGFVSASLHRSPDGAKVTIYAQWRSIEGRAARRRKRLASMGRRSSRAAHAGTGTPHGCSEVPPAALLRYDE